MRTSTVGTVASVLGIFQFIQAEWKDDMSAVTLAVLFFTFGIVLIAFEQIPRYVKWHRERMRRFVRDVHTHDAIGYLNQFTQLGDENGNSTGKLCRELKQAKVDDELPNRIPVWGAHEQDLDECVWIKLLDEEVRLKADDDGMSITIPPYKNLMFSRASLDEAFGPRSDSRKMDDRRIRIFGWRKMVRDADTWIKNNPHRKNELRDVLEANPNYDAEFVVLLHAHPPKNHPAVRGGPRFTQSDPIPWLLQNIDIIEYDWGLSSWKFRLSTFRR